MKKAQWVKINVSGKITPINTSVPCKGVKTQPNTKEQKNDINCG